MSISSMSVSCRARLLCISRCAIVCRNSQRQRSLPSVSATTMTTICGCKSLIQLKSLAEEMQAIVKGLEKVELELNASENDGLVSNLPKTTLSKFVSLFHKTHQENCKQAELDRKKAEKERDGKVQNSDAEKVKMN